MKHHSLVSALTVGAVFLVVTAANAGPTLHSNSEPYKMSKAAAATGRSGNANLAVRALLNKDGSTDIDITTGKLDSTAAAPGNITKVQIKTYNGDADVQWTKNYTALASGGALHYSFNDLHRGQSIQTQANIDKIDKRTDVVTVTGPVKLRPDLSVKGIEAPTRVEIGSQVTIAARVSELNGDIGANADCRLFVDDVEVDRALGVYVDTGGTVSCAFSYKFATAGTRSLKVTVNNVAPADYDTANNSATASIEVFEPNAPSLYGSAWVSSSKGSIDDSDRGHYLRSDGSWSYEQDWASRNQQTIDQQSYSLWASSPTAASFPLASVKVALKSDDLDISGPAFSMADQWYYGDSSYGEGCAWGSDGMSASYQVCSYSWNGYASTHMWSSRWGGDVTYHSEGYSRGHDSWWGSYNYSWNYSGSYGAPSFPVGEKFAIAFEVVDQSGATFAANPTITTSAWTDNLVMGETCHDYSWTWGSDRYCYSRNHSLSGRSGWTSFQSN